MRGKFSDGNRKSFQGAAESEQFFSCERNGFPVDKIVVEPLSKPRARAVEIPLGYIGAVDAVKHFCAKYISYIDWLVHLLLTL